MNYLVLEEFFVFIERLLEYTPVIVLPFIVLGVWAFLFYNGSPVFTQIVIQGFWLLLALPMLVMIGLSVVLLAFALPLQNNPEVFDAFGQIIVVLFFGITFILEYIYISRLIAKIEEKEQMSIWAVIKRSFDADYRKSVKAKKQATLEENRSFFDQITDLNAKKREEEKAAKERLRTVLLKGEDNTSTNETSSE